MKKATIYHNPQCSKSRAALNLLQEHDYSVNIIEYIKQPLSRQQLKELLTLLHIQPSDLLRKNEALYKELALETATAEQIIESMAKHPKLIERPIVLIDHHAIIARPPEKLLGII